MLFQADDVVQVGQPFAILETDEDDQEETPLVKSEALINQPSNNESPISIKEENKISEEKIVKSMSQRFYSPLVKSIASQEGIPFEELEKIKGTGNEGRVTKSDILTYIQSRNIQPTNEDIISKTTVTKESSEVNEVKTEITATKVNIPNTGGTEIVEMDRMRKLISAHMTKSKSTSAHITSFVEADMTSIVNWRNSVKDNFKKKEGQNITFTPIIIEAMAKAVKEFPMINVSVDGTNIHIHKNVNIGMAAALPDGNLIVPVIKECQNKNLIGITKSVNDLAVRARKGALKPDDIQGGTITMTNVGTFGNLMGTPIINQPQVAIMACGVIKKKPVVLETEDGDVIAIRHMMFLSLSYDHRVVDGALGGQFVRKVADYLEQFDNHQTI
jgi:2-oxoglutarate dehydrogenase E2 component (dihydrolipoamide succinyltransferase)